MDNEKEVVLCGASKYSRKFYLNPDFDQLPDDIRKELKIASVLFVEDVGGTMQLVFDQKGNLHIRTDVEEGDALYDEIGAGLRVKKLQNEKAELFERLQIYYKMYALGMDPEEIEQEIRDGQFGADDDD